MLHKTNQICRACLPPSTTPVVPLPINSLGNVKKRKYVKYVFDDDNPLEFQKFFVLTFHYCCYEIYYPPPLPPSPPTVPRFILFFNIRLFFFVVISCEAQSNKYIIFLRFVLLKVFFIRTLPAFLWLSP